MLTIYATYITRYFHGYQNLAKSDIYVCDFVFLFDPEQIFIIL